GVRARKDAVARGHPRALPTLFLADALVAGFAAEVFAAEATGARALLVDSDVGLAAAFFTAAFFAGFAAFSSPSSSLVSLFFSFPDFPALVLPLATLLVLAFAALPLPPPLAARSSISAIASASVTWSLSRSLGMVALTPPALT